MSSVLKHKHRHQDKMTLSSDLPNLCSSAQNSDLQNSLAVAA